MSQRAVVFDLDGTLVDSAPDITIALNAAFREHGAAFSVGDVKKMIGKGADVTISRAMAAADIRETEALHRALYDAFMRSYREVSAEGRGLFPGAVEVLEGLRRDGYRLGLCTNKAQDVTDVAVKALGLVPLLDVVLGAVDDRPKKPHPAMLEKVLADAGSSVARAVMVGDSAADVGVARAAGCPVVVVSFGYTAIPVAELGGDVIVDHLSAVPAAVERLLATT